jgi:tight adherence protein B
MTRRSIAAVILAWMTLTLTLFGGSAQAADGATIGHVKSTKNGLQILVSVPEGTDVALRDVTVTIDGKAAKAKAAPADGESQIRRTTVLVIDVSKSMKGARFVAAQQAATTFLDTVPDDVYVGITTFANKVTPALAPTLDRESARQVLADLKLSRKTRLYDGVIAGAKMAGSDGQRKLLVLSDGADTSDTKLEDAVATITGREVQVDVVALDRAGKGVLALEELATAGDGQVISADTAALQSAFSDEAEALARQVLVTATMPEGVTAASGSVQVSLPTQSETLTAKAFVTFSNVEAPATGSALTPASRFHFALPSWVMYPAVGLVALGLVAMSVALVPGPTKTDLAPEDRVSKYTAMATGMQKAGSPISDRDAALNQAKEAAASMLGRNKSLEARIAARLETAGSSMKPAEWLLVHTGFAVALGLAGVVLSGGSIIVAMIFTAVGVLLPWMYLGFRRGRRLKAFNSSLPDTLQLMAGSLQAGLSLAQSVDTIVREGSEPIAGEFKRVLIETRLGVSLEDALEGVTERFDSKDFAWVVMAIKIQRQVGGNLAELLNTVAGTIREREYMRRQVSALAAEGKLSAIVLGGLPPAFLMYLMIVNRDYVMPIFTTPMGWVMLGGAGLLLSVGIFWMSRLVKVEV